VVDERYTIYCCSNSKVIEYAEENNIKYVIDDNAPKITSITQEGLKIEIIAKDEGAGISKKSYSLDGENWQSSNELAVTESGKYTVYVKDKLGNTVTGTIDVTTSENNDNPNKEDSGNNESEENKAEGENKSGEENKQDNNSEQKDDSQADTVIPDTGSYFPVVIVAILAVAGLISYKKYKKMNIK